MRAFIAVLVAALVGAGVLVGPPSPTGATAPPTVGQAGRWITAPDGRVLIPHGLNQVMKVAPYEPSQDGFGADDAAFLAANGFDAMRVGVIWAAVEPSPGHYDDAYLASVADTVQTLAAHGIYSLLDFHQDLYNEKFQGEGAPAWAVQDGGLPNPALGFPANYFANPAENHAWDAFWGNLPAPDGVGLQVHYARAWAHVAAYFAGSPSVLGYEVLNEPWPGDGWQACLVIGVGCPIFDQAKLTAFYRRVIPAVHAADPGHTVWFEPNVLFNQGMPTHVSPVAPRTGFAFHVYCGLESELGTNVTCPQQDGITFGNADQYSRAHNLPALVTEFGATNDVANLAEVMAYADRYRMGWLEWAYSGNDITSSSPNGQALVLDPRQPPTGDNVVSAKLKALAEPYPQLVAGTPTSWSFSGGVFRLRYSTLRPGTLTAFPAGSETDVAVPAIQFPAGYQVSVTGGHVVSAPGASRLRIVSSPAVTSVSVTVGPG
jgi:endoglycosylceramidase